MQGKVSHARAFVCFAQSGDWRDAAVSRNVSGKLPRSRNGWLEILMDGAVGWVWCYYSESEPERLACHAKVYRHGRA